jgi:hypothetical protein
LVPEGAGELLAQRSGAARPDAPALLDATREHLDTLKTENTRLVAQLAAVEARATAAETRAVGAEARADKLQSLNEGLTALADRISTEFASARQAEVEAAAVPALRDTVAALKAALDAEQARNRELRRARDAGLLERAWRWARARG